MMGSAPSAPFDYEAALLNDRSKQWSIQLPNPVTEKETPIVRHPDCANELVSIVKVNGQTATTLWECFQLGIKSASSPDAHCFGTRVFTPNVGSDGIDVRGDFVWSSYAEVDAEARIVGAALVSLGAAKGDRIGIFSLNRHEWLSLVLAFYSQSLVTVALYSTLGADAISYICDHAQLKIVAVSRDNLKSLVSILPQTQITHVIVFDYNERWQNVKDKFEPSNKAELEAAHPAVKFIGYAELLALGKAHSTTVFPNLPAPDDIAYVMYTSGTTGNPKGAIIHHKNLVASIAAVMISLPALNKNDVYLSYLPLAHIFEAGAVMLMLSYGASIGFFSGNVRKLTEDISIIRPTFFCGVPRVYQRIYQTVFNTVNSSSWLRKYIFMTCYNGQTATIRQGGARSGLYDLVLKAVPKKVGLDRCHTLITGAAPCPAYIIEFLRTIVGGTVLQGYGMTETSATITSVVPGDYHLGHVGPPLRCVEVKLIDIDEMDYRSTDKPYPRGEIVVRGPNIFSGYYKDEESTSAALQHGWLYTGDVGRFNPNGTISIIDRRKNMFKLSQGEYVAAEYIESVYGKSSVVGQIWIYGNSYKSLLMAVIVPQVEALTTYLKNTAHVWPQDKLNISIGSEEFISVFHTVITQNYELIKKYIFDQLHSEESTLKGFERVADIYIESNIDKDSLGFNVTSGLMTPTFKLRRPQLLVKYREILKKMYTSKGEEDKPGEKWPGDQ